MNFGDDMESLFGARARKPADAFGAALALGLVAYAILFSLRALVLTFC